MSRHRKHRGWSYNEWRRDDDGREERRHAGGSDKGNPRGYAYWDYTHWNHVGPGPGFFAGRNFRILSGLHRDPDHGKVAGVCAGIARYYGIPAKGVRIAVIVSLFVNTPLTILGYVIATLLLKPLPEPTLGGQSEVNAGTSAQQQAREEAAEEELPPELRFAALKDKFRALEERTGEMEGLVTSPEFRLRRDFKKMDEG